jgi:polyisoprenoid-binding protein YceI
MAWDIDPFHTLVEFSVRHLTIMTVKGRFPDVHGTIHLDPQYPEHCRVKAQIETASIHTGSSQRDAHLRSADFFEVAKYPTITFESTLIKPMGQNRSILNGDLSLHGVTKPVSMSVMYTGHTRDPFTNAWRVGLCGATMIDRREFCMKYNERNGVGALIVGYEVRIDINIEAVQME